MKRIKRLIGLFVVCLVFVALATSCRQADKVSRNLSQEADNFNVLRQLTVINVRTDKIQFQMTGNFSIKNEGNSELSVIGENVDGTYYKHFVYLTDWVIYVVEDLGKTVVNKYKYEINFNPDMLIPAEIVTID